MPLPKPCLLAEPPLCRSQGANSEIEDLELVKYLRLAELRANAVQYSKCDVSA